jgi:Bacteriophage abortive infection AbiH
MKLYIIGNGFDLRHGLPTSYRNFYHFAKDTLEELVDSYFHIDTSGDRPWNDFESRLSTFDSQIFYDEYNFTDIRSEDFKPSDVYGFSDELVERADELVNGIREQFREWVEGVDVSSASKLFRFESNSRFINFNYTSTLQSVYGVEDSRILHIHGRAGVDSLVFGHGVTIVEEPEFDPESGESNRTMFSDAEASSKYPLHAFRKPVEEIIQNNQSQFTTLQASAEIVVIGHSLNDVDLPYFREIAKGAASSRWVVYCHDQSDLAHHRQQLIRSGVRPESIVTRSYPAHGTASKAAK